MTLNATTSIGPDPKRRRIESSNKPLTKTSELGNEAYTVAWICALEVEQAAAQGMLDTKHPPLLAAKDDTNSYRFGSIGGHNIVITVLRSAGTSPAAIAATNLLRSFPNVRFSLMVGVGGGVPNMSPELDPRKDIHLGDVVVSHPVGHHNGVIQFDYGKSLQGGEFKVTGSLNSPPTILSAAVAGLRGDTRLYGDQIKTIVDEMCARYPEAEFNSPMAAADILFASDQTHIGGEEDCKKCRDPVSRGQRAKPEEPVVHYGTVGSANRVIRDSTYRDQLRRDLGIICVEMEAAGLMQDFPCLVIRGICDYCDSHKNKVWQPYAAATAAAYTKKLLLSIAPEHVVEQKLAREVLEKFVRETHQSMNNIEEKIIFDNLPEADKATYDSVDFQDEDMDYMCLSGTRTELLQQIKDWRSLASGKGIFWLSGAAGTGKSTISRTVAHEADKAGVLGASFFFKRNRGDLNNASRLFTTIAAQLARHVGFARQEIAQAVRNNPRIAEKGLAEQFDKLILQPLSRCQNSSNSIVVIVIDALDECEGDSYVRSIIALLAKAEAIANLGIRIFLTSRPELPIQHGFRRVASSTYENLVLQDIAEEVTKNDLTEYLRAKFIDIQIDNPHLPLNWPGEDRLKSLASMACPLFIFAATIYRFTAESFTDPEEQLAVFLEGRNESLDQINSIYIPILQRAVQTQSLRGASWLSSFRNIVGCIVVAYEALSIKTLASFIDMEPHSILKRLDALHSVLKVHTDLDAPLSLHHLSFANFLLDHTRRHEHDFWVDETDIHKHMALKCFDLLQTSAYLKQDICDLKKPGSLRQDVDPSLIAARLPANVQYACRYWTTHLIASDLLQFEDNARTHVGEQVCKFFKSRFLVWFEALSLLGRASEVVDMISNLVDVQHNIADLAIILEDARRFALTNSYCVGIAPLQLYSSCIAFAPQESFIRHNFTVPTWIRSLPRTTTYWDNLIRTLEGHSDSVKSIIYLSRNKMLVSASWDHTIRIWNEQTGLTEQVINGEEPYTSLACSPREKIFAAGTRGGIIELRDARMGRLLHTVRASPGEQIEKLAFSSDGKLLASTSSNHRPYYRLQLWRISSTRPNCCQILEDHTNTNEDIFRYARTIAFLPDSRMLVLGSIRDINLFVWNSGHLECLQSVCTLVASEEILFSLSRKFLITADKYSVALWSVNFDEPKIDHLTTLSGYFNPILSLNINVLAISSDVKLGLFEIDLEAPSLREISSIQIHESSTSLTLMSARNLLATGSRSGKISLWDMNLQSSQSNLADEHSEDNENLVFSFDCKFLSSTSRNGCTRIWQMTSGQPVFQQILPVSTDNPWQTTLMYGDNLIVSSGYSDTIRLFSMTTGQLLRLLKVTDTHRNNLALSSNGRFLIHDSRKTKFMQLKSRNRLWGKKDTIISLWDTTYWKPRDPRVLERSEFDHMDCSHDGKLLVGVKKNKLHLWDIVTPRKLRVVKFARSVNWVRFQENPLRVETNLGMFSIVEFEGDWFIELYRGIPSSFYELQDSWIAYGGHRVLWFPGQYHSNFESGGDMIAFTSMSGAISTFEMASADLQREGLINDHQEDPWFEVTSPTEHSDDSGWETSLELTSLLTSEEEEEQEEEEEE